MLDVGEIQKAIVWTPLSKTNHYMQCLNGALSFITQSYKIKIPDFKDYHEEVKQILTWSIKQEL